MKNRIIAVVGPTASGKTTLAIEIAEKIGGEIVSCDSMQIYKGMPIASAVATETEKKRVPHHLVEFLEPEESFSVAEYVDIAKKCIDDILCRGKVPVLCGGTGLYYSSLIDNVSFESQPGCTDLREKLKKELEENSPEYMHEKLASVDPEAAEKLNVSDTRRVIRALELIYITNLTAKDREIISKAQPSPYDFKVIGIDFADRSKLYERIEKRIDIMVENGLLEEAKIGYLRSGTSAQAIGHKEFYPYFSGEITLAQAVDNLKTATRRYAKRQLTWFRRDERINWIMADETENMLSAAMKTIAE